MIFYDINLEVDGKVPHAKSASLIKKRQPLMTILYHKRISLSIVIIRGRVLIIPKLMILCLKVQTVKQCAFLTELTFHSRLITY